jgi:proteasome accessory factor B
VSPYGLGLFRGAWYLVGHDHARKAIRVFKIARIEGGIDPAPGGPKPEDHVPENFSVQEHLPREAFDLGSGEPTSVVLRVVGPADRAAFAPGVFPRVLAEEAGVTTVSVLVRHPLALVPWILSCGGDVEVVEPATLRGAVSDATRALLQAHRGGGRENSS